MKFQSTRFGVIEVEDDKVLTLPKGLIGFAHLTRWAVLSGGPDALFMWLHSVEDPDIAVPVTNPLTFYPEFRFRVTADDLQVFGHDDLERLDVLAVVTAAERVEDCTVNLRAPILLDQDARVAVQAVNQTGDYPVRAPLWANVQLDELAVRSQAEED